MNAKRAIGGWLFVGELPPSEASNDIVHHRVLVRRW
jgi:hypothetical protein